MFFQKANVLGFGYSQLGFGMCRGEGWSSSGWPVDKGSKTMKDCAESCSKTREEIMSCHFLVGISVCKHILHFVLVLYKYVKIWEVKNRLHSTHI